MTGDVLDMERLVARCRIALTVVAIVAAAMDPAKPALMVRLGLAGGQLGPEALALFALWGYFFYSLLVYAAVTLRLAPGGIAWVTTWLDVVFSAVIALFTEGTNSPFYVFLGFAVVAAAVRWGFRYSMLVTMVSIWVYLALIVVSAYRAEFTNFYIMRPAYLAIVGYLVAYLGRHRLKLEEKVRALERARERNEIARSLHDGCVQTLAGGTMMLASCQELLRRGRNDELLTILGDLQTSLTREYDELRAYVRALVDHEVTPPSNREFTTRFAVSAEFNGSGAVVEHVLHIMLEAARNVRRHAFARTARIEARGDGVEVHIAIDDDGLGFPDGTPAPWSIASRVSQLGGQLELLRDGRPGAHLAIALRAA
jgi:signal transduction histidine kinase